MNEHRYVTDAEAKAALDKLPSEPTASLLVLLKRLLADRDVAMEMIEELMEITHDLTEEDGDDVQIVNLKARALIAAVKGRNDASHCHTPMSSLFYTLRLYG